MKSAILTAQTRSEEDFRLLARMLDALGLRNGEVEEYKSFRLQPFFPSELILEVVHRKNPRPHADLILMISDPDSAVEIIRKMGMQIDDDHSGSEPHHIGRNFRVQLPGRTTISVSGLRTTSSTEPSHQGVVGSLSAMGKKVCIVVSRFNSFITERLLSETL